MLVILVVGATKEA